VAGGDGVAPEVAARRCTAPARHQSAIISTSTATRRLKDVNCDESSPLASIVQDRCDPAPPSSCKPPAARQTPTGHVACRRPGAIPRPLSGTRPQRNGSATQKPHRHLKQIPGDEEYRMVTVIARCAAACTPSPPEGNNAGNTSRTPNWQSTRPYTRPIPVGNGIWPTTCAGESRMSRPACGTDVGQLH
jgi:hypothetical protein